MINLKEKNILCNTKEEFEAIIKEAISQKVVWYTGRMINLDDLGFEIIPVVLCFNDLITLSWKNPNDCDKEDYFITDLAKDLLNTDREMTAHEFLNKYLEMTDGECGLCEKCKKIPYRSKKGEWCNPGYWTKENIDQVYEIVKSGNKLEELPEQKAIDNLKHFLDEDEELKYESVKLAIEVLEEKLNEKQK